MKHIKKIDEMYFGKRISEKPYKLSNEERQKIKDIVARMGEAETEMRELLNELTTECGAFARGFDSFEFDGDVITRDCIDKWKKYMEEIDKFCYFA